MSVTRPHRSITKSPSRKIPLKPHLLAAYLFPQLLLVFFACLFRVAVAMFIMSPHIWGDGDGGFGLGEPFSLVSADSAASYRREMNLFLTGATFRDPLLNYTTIGEGGTIDKMGNDNNFADYLYEKLLGTSLCHWLRTNHNLSLLDSDTSNSRCPMYYLKQIYSSSSARIAIFLSSIFDELKPDKFLLVNISSSTEIRCSFVTPRASANALVRTVPQISEQSAIISLVFPSGTTFYLNTESLMFVFLDTVTCLMLVLIARRVVVNEFELDCPAKKVLSEGKDRNSEDMTAKQGDQDFSNTSETREYNVLMPHLLRYCDAVCQEKSAEVHAPRTHYLVRNLSISRVASFYLFNPLQLLICGLCSTRVVEQALLVGMGLCVVYLPVRSRRRENAVWWTVQYLSVCGVLTLLGLLVSHSVSTNEALKVPAMYALLLLTATADTPFTEGSSVDLNRNYHSNNAKTPPKNSVCTTRISLEKYILMFVVPVVTLTVWRLLDALKSSEEESSIYTFPPCAGTIAYMFQLLVPHTFPLYTSLMAYLPVVVALVVGLTLASFAHEDDVPFAEQSAVYNNRHWSSKESQLTSSEIIDHTIPIDHCEYVDYLPFYSLRILLVLTINTTTLMRSHYVLGDTFFTIFIAMVLVPEGFKAQMSSYKTVTPALLMLLSIPFLHATYVSWVVTQLANANWMYFAALAHQGGLCLYIVEQLKDSLSVAKKRSKSHYME